MDMLEKDKKMNLLDEPEETDSGMYLSVLADEPGEAKAAMYLNSLVDDPEVLNNDAEHFIEAVEKTGRDGENTKRPD